MAKDGTNRGGQRVGAGRKSKALTDKIASGKANSASVITLPEPVSFEGADVPPIKEYLIVIKIHKIFLLLSVPEIRELFTDTQQTKHGTIYRFPLC